MDINKIANLLSEDVNYNNGLLIESKCPSCGTEDAYHGFTTIECPNPKCRHYKPSLVNRNEIIPDYFDAIFNGNKKLRLTIQKPHPSPIDIYGFIVTDDGGSQYYVMMDDGKIYHLPLNFMKLTSNDVIGVVPNIKDQLKG